MARPLRIEYPGAFYHVIQRGIERKNIFASDVDRQKFLFLLNAAHTSYRAVFHSYVLMNNHYHLILETPDAPLSKIMHYINASYAGYFNATHKRVGPLYQGRFKAILVQADAYLHYLSCYIHLNPVRAGIVKSPEKYPHSSYNSFISNIEPPAWLDTNLMLSMFDKKRSIARRLYRQFVTDNTGKEKDIIEAHDKGGLVLGDDDFFAGIKERFIDIRKEEPEIPALKVFAVRKAPSMESIRSIAERHIPNDKRLARSLAIYLTRKYTHNTLNAIASFYGGIKYTGVSQVFRRMETRRGEDKNIASLIAKLEPEMMKCEV